MGAINPSISPLILSRMADRLRAHETRGTSRCRCAHPSPVSCVTSCSLRDRPPSVSIDLFDARRHRSAATEPTSPLPGARGPRQPGRAQVEGVVLHGRGQGTGSGRGVRRDPSLAAILQPRIEPSARRLVTRVSKGTDELTEVIGVGKRVGR